jgi:hypothetical protein
MRDVIEREKREVMKTEKDARLCLVACSDRAETDGDMFSGQLRESRT